MVCQWNIYRKTAYLLLKIVQNVVFNYLGLFKVYRKNIWIDFEQTEGFLRRRFSAVAAVPNKATNIFSDRWMEF